MKQLNKKAVNSYIGSFIVEESKGAVVTIYKSMDWANDMSEPLDDAIDKIKKYLGGFVTSIDVPIAIDGTNHQLRVWREICLIPYGETRTYGYIANKIKSSALAVGTACGKNPVPLIIPCHRVVPAKGIGKYSFMQGATTKNKLLELEKACVKNVQQ